LSNERRRARRHGSGERVILVLEGAPERGEPRAPIASKRRLAPNRRLLPGGRTGRRAEASPGAGEGAGI